MKPIQMDGQSRNNNNNNDFLFIALYKINKLNKWKIFVPILMCYDQQNVVDMPMHQLV